MPLGSVLPGYTNSGNAVKTAGAAHRFRCLSVSNKAHGKQELSRISCFYHAKSQVLAHPDPAQAHTQGPLDHALQGVESPGISFAKILTRGSVTGEAAQELGKNALALATARLRR